MNSFDFASVPSFTEFNQLSDASNYHELSADWWVIITDIQGSTRAIQEGRYKDVNLIGAASIMAILNAVRPLEIPYVFGGDGATVCVPNSVIEMVKPALRAAKRMSEQQFQLGLRLGLVPVSVIQEAGKQIRIAKFQASPHYAQAMFSGNGLQYAEGLVKDPNDTQYCLSDNPDDDCSGDFSGLECRWKNINSPAGEMHSILVAAREQNEQNQQSIYTNILERVNAIYPNEANASPVTEAHLKLSTDTKQLQGECKVRSFGSSRFAAWTYRHSLSWIVRIGRALMRLGFGHWRHYRADLIANTDYRKFDEMLRMVIAGSTEQRHQLRQVLQAEHDAGHIFFGIHHAESALMTCVIFQYHNNHVHFIDGANGGYAMAAKELKAQIKAASASS